MLWQEMLLIHVGSIFFGVMKHFDGIFKFYNLFIVEKL